MLKEAGVILIIVGTTGVGYYYGTMIRMRLENLKELRKSMLLLQGEIRYGKTPIPEAFCAIAERSEKEFQQFFSNMGKALFSFSEGTLFEVWKKGIDKDLGEISLTKEDKKMLEKLGEQLGYLDQTMQINSIELYLTQVNQVIEEIGQSIGEKTRLYHMLGILGGIFLSIVLI